MQTLSKPVFWGSWLIALAICYWYVDLPLTMFLQHLDHHQRWITPLFDQINRLGSSGSYLLACGFLFLWGFYIEKNPQLVWTSLYILLAIVISGIACDVLKIFFGRARPSEYFTSQLYGFYFLELNHRYWSLPSGHVTTISATVTAIYLSIRRFGGILFTGLMLVFLGRMVCRAHYLSDVMAGAYLGFIIAFSLHYWLIQKRGEPVAG